MVIRIVIAYLIFRKQKFAFLEFLLSINPELGIEFL